VTERRTPYSYRTPAPVKPRDYVPHARQRESRAIRDAIKKAQEAVHQEFVVQENSQVRQAGAAEADGAFVQAFKARAEKSLYAFATGVLGYTFLYPPFHKPVCDWLQDVGNPHYRTLLLMPRDHAKTTLIARALPLHMWIQPADRNRYFKGMPGCDTRIMLAGEKEERAIDNLRVLRSHLEGNDLLRAWWPHICWANARKESPEWNKTTLILPRTCEFAEPSIRAVGVGAAYTGQHPCCQIKDDITTERAANSEVEMQTAIEWDRNTAALFSNPATDLEFTAGTYWAVHDLPHVKEADPSVRVNTKWRAVEDEHGEILWPAKMNKALIGRLAEHFGPRFHLLYRNEVRDASLLDFDVTDLRFFDFDGVTLTWNDDPRDDAVPGIFATPAYTEPIIPDLRGRALHDDTTQDALRLRAFRLRMR